jgi:hypothetical protein
MTFNYYGNCSLCKIMIFIMNILLKLLVGIDKETLVRKVLLIGRF